MRTNIEIADRLMDNALALGYKTKREAVEAGLRLLAQRRASYDKALALGGTVAWEGDLHTERKDKVRRSVQPRRKANAT